MDFKISLLEYLDNIPFGYVTTYKALSNKFGINCRLVASILSKNNDYKYDCYKVISSSGHISGYNLGVLKKRELLLSFGVKFKNLNYIRDECILREL